MPATGERRKPPKKLTEEQQKLKEKRKKEALEKKSKIWSWLDKIYYRQSIKF